MERSTSNLVVCCNCHRVKFGGEWLNQEKAPVRLQTALNDGSLLVSHGLCASCRSALYGKLP